jgi:hypothetical protein
MGANQRRCCHGPNGPKADEPGSESEVVCYRARTVEESEGAGQDRPLEPVFLPQHQPDCMANVIGNRSIRWLVVGAAVLTLAYTANYCLQWKGVNSVVSRVTHGGFSVSYTRFDGVGTGYIFSSVELPSNFKEMYKVGDVVAVFYCPSANATVLASVFWARAGLGAGVGSVLLVAGLFGLRSRPLARVQSEAPALPAPTRAAVQEDQSTGVNQVDPKQTAEEAEG